MKWFAFETYKFNTIMIQADSQSRAWENYEFAGFSRDDCHQVTEQPSLFCSNHSHRDEQSSCALSA